MQAQHAKQNIDGQASTSGLSWETDREVIAKHYTKATSTLSPRWKPVTRLHKFTANAPARLTCTGCTRSSHCMQKAGMTFLRLKCDLRDADLPLHSFACVGFDVKPK